MKQGTRRLLFWVAVIVFGASSWIAVRYAQGYKYDFSNDRFVRTGTIAVTANTDAKVFVDDRLIGSLSFFNHTVGANKLLPGTYTVRLVKDGYSAWRKDATVSEGILTEFPSVMLLPTDEDSQVALRIEASNSFGAAFTLARATPAPTPIPGKKSPVITPSVTVGIWSLRGTDLLRTDVTASGSFVGRGVLGFIVSGDRILWWTRNEVWVLWTDATNSQPFRSAGEQDMITRWSVPILRAGWFRDHEHIVVDLGSQGYRMVETDTRGGLNVVRF